MINLPIGDIIRDSFKLAWKYKYLWLFGVFVAGSGFGNFQGNLEPADIDAAYEWILAALVAIILIGLVVLTVVLILHVISKSALIYNVYQIDTGGAHSISAGWDFGLKRFWPMLGVTLLQIVVTVAFVFVLILAEVLFFVVSTVLGFFSLLFALPVFFAGLMALSLMWTYAERFVALETRGVVEALGEGMSLMRSQWRPSLLMLVVKIGIAIGAGIALLGVGAALFLPAVALWMISKPVAIVYGIMVLLPFTVLLTAYFGTFDSAVWTKVFLQLRAPSYASSEPASSGPSPTPDPEPPSARPPLFE